jgi:hypothetical protein
MPRINALARKEQFVLKTQFLAQSKGVQQQSYNYFINKVGRALPSSGYA